MTNREGEHPVSLKEYQEQQEAYPESTELWQGLPGARMKSGREVEKLKEKGEINKGIANTSNPVLLLPLAQHVHMRLHMSTFSLELYLAICLF